MRVVATAGHVDHGKSSLVRALTGTDPDRFPEEKERGLTIDLGFAFCSLPSGQVVGFVDVPGHERFVKNMLAGVGAVDVALLVVAANEGWMPQTEEHMQILDLLDVRHGMVALTKTTLVDAEALAAMWLDVEARVGWPVVSVDSLTGRGLDDARALLDTVLHNAPAPCDAGRPRVWVDRVFTVRGAGTVVTGTLTGGALARDQEVMIEPGDRRAIRIRGIESRHVELDHARPGTRVALNLTGVDHTAIERGVAVVAPDQWAVVETVDVALRVLPGRSLPKRGTVHAHAGSGDQVARLRLLDGDGRYARLRLSTALPLAPGDRLVLRSSGAQATVAGAEVLDVAPARTTAEALERVSRPLGERVLEARPWCTPAEMARLAGDEHAADGYAVTIGKWMVAPETLLRVRARAVKMAEAEPVPLTAVATACGIDAARLRAALVDDPSLVIEHDVVRTSGQPGVVEDAAARDLIAALRASPLAPPAPADLGAPRSLVRALVRAGAVIELDGIVFATSALDNARERISQLVIERESITVADVRDLLGTSRKYVLPIVNRMDAEGVTRRRGDLRVPGPRARSS
jgi:selenocysteine-specific elongation factor